MKTPEYRGPYIGDKAKGRGASSSDVRQIRKRQEKAALQITLKLGAGSSAMTLNGQTAELHGEEQIDLAWNVIKKALFAKYPVYDVQRLLRSAS